MPSVPLWLDQSFRDHHIHPLVAHLAMALVDAHFAEAQSADKLAAGSVRSQQASNQFVVFALRRQGDQCFEEQPAETLVSRAATDVDARLPNAVVTLAW